jgi:nucleoside 2-deoxyribosyltransferase
MLKIYLAGYIQGDVIKECTEWRKQLRDHYTKTKYMNITWLDPLSSENFAEISPDGLDSSMPAHTIVHKDYTCVEKCDLIIVNMDTFGQDRPLTGTICELAWGWQMHKGIIMITDEPKYKHHPFLEYFSSWTVKDIDELIEKEVVTGFYESWHTAKY